MKKEGSSWHQHISSTLEKLAASIADSFTKLSSDSSFANKLLNEVNQSEFVNVIQSLSRGIELFTKINTDKCTNQPGKVYVVNIKVRCKGNHIVLVKEVSLLFNFLFSIAKPTLICVRNQFLDASCVLFYDNRHLDREN